MNRHKVQIYVLGQRIDTYDDESITINSKIQDVKDIEKVFADFSRSITVPASKNNNAVFRHVFRSDGGNAAGTLDARRMLPAQISVNGAVFKKGYIQFENGDIKSGKQHTYTFRFYGGLVTLPAQLKDKRVYELNEFDNTDKWELKYTNQDDLSDKWKDLLTKGFDEDLASGFPDIWNDNIRVALGCEGDGYYYSEDDTDHERENYTNLYYNTDSDYLEGNTGADMHPGNMPASIRSSVLLEAVENEFSAEIEGSNKYNLGSLRFSRGEEKVRVGDIDVYYPTDDESKVVDGRNHFFSSDTFKDSMTVCRRKAKDDELADVPWRIVPFEQTWGNIGPSDVLPKGNDDTEDNHSFVVFTDPGGKKKNEVNYYYDLDVEVVSGAGAWQVQLYDITNKEEKWNSGVRLGAFQMRNDEDTTEDSRWNPEQDWRERGNGLSGGKVTEGGIVEGSRDAAGLRIEQKDKGSRKPIKAAAYCWRVKVAEGTEIRLKPTVTCEVRSFGDPITTRDAINATTIGAAATIGGYTSIAGLLVAAGGLAISVPVAGFIIAAVVLLVKLINNFQRDVKITRNESVTSEEGQVFPLSAYIPDIKVMDMLTGWFKLWNLTAYTDNDRYGNEIVVVKELDKFYEDGEKKDITKYVDNQELKVSTPTFYNPLIFKYKDPKDYTTTYYKDIQNGNDKKYGWGGAGYENTDILEAGFMPYREYKIEVPFSLIYPTLPSDEKLDKDKQVPLGIAFNWYVDNSRSSTEIDFPIHYLDPLGGTFATKTIMGRRNGAAQELTKWNQPTFIRRNSIDEPKDSLSFGAVTRDINRNTAVDVPSIYQARYENYVDEVFNFRSKVFKFKARLPFGELQKIGLDDTIVISNKQYRINELKVNVNTGETEFTVLSLNDADTNTAPEVIQNEDELELVSYTSSIPEGDTLINFDTIYFEVQVAKGTLRYTYTWVKNGEIQANEKNATYVLTNAMEGDMVYVIVDDGNQKITTHNIVVPEINMSPVVSIAITTGAENNAEGDMVVLTATASDAESDAFSLQWYKDGSPIPGETGSTYTIESFAESDAGAYYVVAVAETGSLEPTESASVFLELSNFTATYNLTNNISGPAAGYVIADVPEQGGSDGETYSFTDPEVTLNAGYYWVTTPSFSGTDPLSGTFVDGGPEEIDVNRQVSGEVALMVAFAFSDWTGTVSSLPASGGTPTIAVGNAAMATTTNSFASNDGCAEITRAVTVNVTVPDADKWNNSGSVISDNVNVQQAALSMFPTDAPSFSVNQNGTINGDSNYVYTPSSFPANTTCSGISRSASWTLTVPAGYCNSGDVVNSSTNVVATQPSLDEYTASAPSFSVNQSGTISAVSGYTFTPSSFSANTDCDAVSVSATWNFTAPAGYCNSGDVLSGNVNTSQPGLATFDASNWTGSFAVASNGTPSVASSGNMSSVAVTSGTFDVVCDATTRTVNGTGVVPAGYCNSGDTINISDNVTQPALPMFAFADAGVSGFGVDASGTITAPTASSGTLGTITYVGASGTPPSYATVSTATVRTATVNVTVPAGYCNTGDTVSGSVTTTQPAMAAPLTVSFSGNFSDVPNGSTLTTTATASGGNGNPITYQWTVLSGASAVLPASQNGNPVDWDNVNAGGPFIGVRIQVTASQSGSSPATFSALHKFLGTA